MKKFLLLVKAIFSPKFRCILFGLHELPFKIQKRYKYTWPAYTNKKLDTNYFDWANSTEYVAEQEELRLICPRCKSGVSRWHQVCKPVQKHQDDLPREIWSESVLANPNIFVVQEKA